MSLTVLAMRASTSDLRSWAILPARLSSLGADRVLPCWSMTATFSAFMFGTDDETRFWMARTMSDEGSREPTPMVTAAEGCSASSSNS